MSSHAFLDAMNEVEELCNFDVSMKLSMRATIEKESSENELQRSPRKDHY